MTTLFDSRLSWRDYASHLLHVGDLLEWAKSKRLHLKTTPPINGFEFVQVEALLCAIERHAGELTPDQALEIVLNNPVLKNDPIFQKYPDDIDPTTCRWLIGAEAHRKWRELLTGAIAAHELALLDFGSKLPIDTAPAQVPTLAPVAVVALGEPDKVTAKPATNWRMKIQAEAYEHWIRLLASGCSPTPNSILDDLVTWCATNNVRTDTGIYPGAGHIKNTVINGRLWTQPTMSREQAKKHVAQVAQVAHSKAA